MGGMDLADSLRARLDEDEQVARACEGPKWLARPERDPDVDAWFPTDVVLRTAETGHTLWYDEGRDVQEEAVHAARHDPARVLAEVAAKRRIIELHPEVRFTNVGLGIRDAAVCLRCHTVMDSPDDWPEDGPEWSYPLVQEPYPCATVRALDLA